MYFHFYIFPPHHCPKKKALTSNLERMVILITREGAGSLSPAHEYGGSGLRRHSLPVELVQPAPARASSQSVSQSVVGSAAAWPLCKLYSATSWKLSG